MAGKVALVTGSTRGLGLATVKSLLKRKVEAVYVTGTNMKEGKKALQSLEKEGLKAHSHELDVTDKDSVRQCAYHIENNHDGLDYLVNNAGIMDLGNHYPCYEEAKRNIDVNYRGVLLMERFFFPLLRKDARVVNISSACGHLSNLYNKHWISLLKNPHLTVAQINYFVDIYLASVRDGTFNPLDFVDEGKHAEHRVSKIAVTALTMIQAKKYAERSISVNALHPGHMKTKMALGGGTREPEESARLVIFLLLDAGKGITGRFLWENGRFVDWSDVTADLYYRHEDVE